MAAIRDTGFYGRAIGRWLCALGMVAGESLLAQDAKPIPIPLTENGATTTLHVYTNLIQIPVVVLGPNRQHLTVPIDPSRFSVSIGSGPWFRATHVRVEGDGALSLAILLDVHSDSAGIMDEIGAEIASLAPDVLHAEDHVSIYALDCSLIRGASNIPATAEGLKHGVELALGAWNERKHTKPVPKCETTIPLHEALRRVVSGLSSLPGRRTILAVTDGKDVSNKSEWADVTNDAGMSGTAVFGLVTYPQVFRIAMGTSGRLPYRTGAENPFNALCDFSGGMVTLTYGDWLQSALMRYVTTLRERYIVEFPRPSNSTAGKHSLAVRVEKSNDFIRAAGVSLPVADAAVMADPTTISTGPSNTPVQGERRELEKR